MTRPPLTVRERSKFRSLQDVIGCKWSAGMVGATQCGLQRPGELERFIPGISTKGVNERLRKLLAYGLIARTEHPGLTARVDDALAPAGRKLPAIIEQIRAPNSDHTPPSKKV